MLAALATLAFLATAGLALMVVWRMLDESGGKIVAALKGQSPLASLPQHATVPVRVRYRTMPERRAHAEPKLRAAA